MDIDVKNGVTISLITDCVAMRAPHFFIMQNGDEVIIAGSMLERFASSLATAMTRNDEIRDLITESYKQFKND